MAMVRKHAIVAGRVQGVFFRAYAMKEAQRLGLTGWCKNRWDGRVETVFEGEEDAAKKMVDWLHKGSPCSRVELVEVLDEKPTGEYKDFRMDY